MREALTRAMRRPVALVLAPSGFGKSHALHAVAGTSVARLRGPFGSLADVARACARAAAPDTPAIDAAVRALARSALEAADPADVFAAWIAENVRGDRTLVLDDLDDALGVPGASQLIAGLVARTSSRVRWVLAARGADAFPVARWLADGLTAVPIDETVLSLRPDELRCVADDRAIERTALRGVEPRPATVALTCDLLAAGSPRRGIAAHVRSLQSLVEFAFADADPDERRVLAIAAHVPVLDDSLAAAIPVPGAPALLQRLRARLPSALGPSGCEPWFAATIRHRTVLDARFDQSVLEAIETYETAGRAEDALRVAMQTNRADSIATLLMRHGARFLIAGIPAPAVDALAAFTEPLADAGALAMQAALAAERGFDDVAERWFAAAMTRAGGALRAAVVQRSSVEALRRGRDPIDVLERYLATSTEPRATLASLRGTLAVAYAQVERHADARDAIEAAAADARAIGLDDVALAILEQQRAFVALRRGDAEGADAAARHAVALAEQRGAHDVAARAHSVRYELALDADEPLAAIAALEDIARCAALAGDLELRAVSLLRAFELHATAGHDDALPRIESILAADASAPAVRLRAGLAGGRAFMRAWRGEFERAYGLVAGTAVDGPNPGARAMRYAEIARYAAACGRASEARDATAAAEAELHQVTQSAVRDGVVASLVLAATLLGDDAAAVRRLPRAPAGESARRSAALLDLAATYRRHARGESTARELADALERARARGFGGFARVIEALPRRLGPPA